MANTNAPVATTYKTIQIPLAGASNSRAGQLNKDRRTVNFLPEGVASVLTGEKDVCLKARPGVTSYLTLPSGTPRGSYFWNSVSYTVVGNTLYANSSPLITLSTSAGTVGFTTVNGVSIQQLFFCDGINGYVITNSTTYTQVTSPDFPTPHNPIIVSQDGYVLVADTTDNIYNSDLQDPLTWTAGNFISAEMYPDAIVGLIKMKNYIIALGSTSMEFFFDPGTITSGSPFQRNDSLAKKMGTQAQDSISCTEDQLIFMGTTDTSGLSVFLLDGSTLNEIADIRVKQCLEYLKAGNVEGYIVRIEGHKLYILNMYRTNFEHTFVFDFDTKMWVEWEYTTGLHFPFKYSTTDDLREVILQHSTNGSLYRLDYATTNDFGSDIICTIQTSKIDGDTTRYKDHDRLSLMYDSEVTPFPVTVSWSDDDYNTWISRLVNFSQISSFTSKLGKSRRRAYRLTFVITTVIRINTIELDINIMSM